MGIAPHYIAAADGRIQSIRAWARELKLSPAALHQRLARGWIPEDAVTPRRRQGRARRYIVVGETRRTLTEWAKASGLALTTIHRRLTAGWDPAAAVNTPPLPPKRKRPS